MARLILDVMGGDHAPHEILLGAQKALAELALATSGDGGGELVLVGDEAVIRKRLNGRKLRLLAQALEQSAANAAGPGFRVSILHAPESIEMDDSIRAVRNKPGASINVGCKLAAESYKNSKLAGSPGPSGFVSAGHSGAMMASALLNMGRLEGIERPAIAVKLPTLNPDGCVILDVGANVDCKPEHLRDFAVMGAIYADVERKTRSLPRVGVLSNGEEPGKGTELTRTALGLIEALPCFQGLNRIGDFMGYVEGKEIFKGKVDAVVCDGFVGNVVLKSLEGMGSAVVSTMKQEAKKNWVALAGFLLAAPVFHRLKRKLDYAETGAAPLLGVAGYAFICHGRSDARAIKNALLRARSAMDGRYTEKLEAALTRTL